MTTYLLTVAIIFSVMISGIVMEKVYRRFQSRHPELGPFRRRDGREQAKKRRTQGCGQGKTSREGHGFVSVYVMNRCRHTGAGIGTQL